MVEAAIAEGAQVVVRGGPVTDGPLARGAFYRPTLLEVARSEMDVVQQEVFGPVLTLQRFESEAQAIELANVTPYGLSASIWSRDIDRPLRVAREVQAGSISPSGSPTRSPPTARSTTPFTAKPAQLSGRKAWWICFTWRAVTTPSPLS